MKMNNDKIITIAEIGENHIGDMNIAKMLIRQAASAGADYIKFQSYKAGNFKKDDPEYEWFKKVSLSDEDHFKLRDYAKKHKIKFLSSPFSLERAKFLCERLGLKEIKIASGVMLNFKILDYVNKHAHTVFLSTGMATVKEIKLALSNLKKVKNCYILHCVSQYPCQDEEANLKAILSLRKQFKYPIGYSDHTIGTEACVAAVALGARVIEKHFTFDKKCHEGTDHILSANADEFKKMVEKIGRIAKMLGKEEKKPTKGEKKILHFVRERFLEN
jgi:N,N'-diacetyllegionaminate synthase